MLGWADMGDWYGRDAAGEWLGTMKPPSFMTGRAAGFHEGGAWMLRLVMSVRSRPAVSIRLDCFVPSLWMWMDRFVGDPGVRELIGSLLGVPVPADEVELLELLPPHRHFWTLGIAAVTPPHPQGLFGGCGHALSGRPGFRTGTISRSFAWLHFVER